MIATLMMLAKFANPGLLQITLFWKKKWRHTYNSDFPGDFPWNKIADKITSKPKDSITPTETEKFDTNPLETPKNILNIRKMPKINDELNWYKFNI